MNIDSEMILNCSVYEIDFGMLFIGEHIKERLNIRGFLDSLRSSGVETGGPSALSPRDKQAIANSLDQLIRKH